MYRPLCTGCSFRRHFFGLRYHKSTLGSLEGTLLHGLHVSHMGLSTKKSGMERGSQTFHFFGTLKQILFYQQFATSEIQEAACPGSSSTDPVELRCSECVVTFLHTPQFMRGNPLNQTFIFHEDGFNAFVKKSRGMATIQLCSACTFKDEQSKGKYLSVYSFIPSCSIGEGIPHKLDAFLKPLMDDVVDLFINGRDIHIPHPMRIGDSLIPAGIHKVRMCLLCHPLLKVWLNQG